MVQRFVCGVFVFDFFVGFWFSRGCGILVFLWRFWCFPGFGVALSFGFVLLWFLWFLRCGLWLCFRAVVFFSWVDIIQCIVTLWVFAAFVDFVVWVSCDLWVLGFLGFVVFGFPEGLWFSDFCFAIGLGLRFAVLRFVIYVCGLWIFFVFCGFAAV